MNEANSYLQEELRKARRTYRNTLIAMGVVVVVMLGYFQWLKSELRSVLQPSTLAEFVVNEARRTIPEAGDALQASLTNSAPDMVRFVMQSAVDAVLPVVRAELEANVKEFAREMTAAGTQGMATAFSSVLQAHKAELAKYGPADAEKLGAALSKHLSAELATRLDDTGEESLKTKLDESVLALRRIDTHLQAMAKDKAPSREDALGKRLITTWWTFLDRNAGELPSGSLLAGEPTRSL